MRTPVGPLLLFSALSAALLWVVNTGEAHAYIDAGSGSLMLQVLAGSALAGAFMLKVFWRRLTGRVSRFFSKMKGLKR